MNRKVIVAWILTIILSTIGGVIAGSSSKSGIKSEISLRDSIYYVMGEYDIKYPDIVYAQAVLETGNFKAGIFTKKQNLFGLRGKKGYYSFQHWSESVKMYKEKIQSRYREGEDYYHFLKRIHYAENPNYTKSLKKLVKK